MKGGFFISKRRFPIDKELLLKINEGDDNALNVLLEKYRSFSHRLVNDFLEENPNYEYIRDELHAVIFYNTYNLINKYKMDKGLFFGYWKKISLRLITKYIERYEKYNSVISLDYQPSNDAKVLHEVIGSEDGVYRQDLLKQVFISVVNNPCNDFSEREKKVINYYLEGWDMKEIAEALGRSLPSVYRIYKQAVEKIGSVLRGPKQ